MKKEVDTDKFSFEALMTMDMTKLKKKKKVKDVIDESDKSCLSFTTTTSTVRGGATNEAQSDDLTDREAALLATSRKKGGGAMMMASKKQKYVSKVYSLFDMAQKTLVNYPNHLLSCVHLFVYPADVLMPALERLDEKTLNFVSAIQKNH